jgi:hypothetical protein
MRRIAGLGWVPDLPDARDRKFAAPPVNSDVKLGPDWSSGLKPAFNQGQAGACTGNMFAAQVLFLQKAQGESVEMPSRLFSYWVARAREGTTYADCGAQIRDILVGAIADGICPESVWGYGDTPAAVTMRPSQAAFQRAQSCEVLSYERVDNTRESDLVAALLLGPLCGGVTLYDSFESGDVTRTGMVPMPGQNESIIGGHALWWCQVDLARRLVKFRNSWGTGWGQNGYGWMPMEYLLDGNLAADFWRIDRMT